MKVQCSTTNGKFRAEIEGTEKEVVEQLARFQELFDDDCCGVCGTDKVRFQVRDVEDNKYYELICCNQDCRAKLAFGQHKKGNTLFPKREGKDGKYDRKNRGWSKWTPENK